jgi:hypothetical protein
MIRTFIRIPPDSGPRLPSPHLADVVRFTVPAGAHTDTFRGQLPTRQHVVYVLADAEGRALYIGQSAQPRLRLRRHCLTQPWWHAVAQVELHPVAGEKAARVLERDLTARLRPSHSQVTASELLRLDRMLSTAGQRG